jgi:hypothetical protein
MVTLPRENWDDYSPDQLAENLHSSGQVEAARFGDSSPLNNPTNYTYGFKTREDALGLLQITGFTENPPAALIRYKLVPPAALADTNTDTAMPAAVRDLSEETLNERLDAASSISDPTERDKPLASVATDAAEAGELEIVRKALGLLSDESRDDVTHEAAGLLVKRGLRKQAIELAKGISDDTIRNQALGELAQ